jgi:hypothetical protein
MAKGGILTAAFDYPAAKTNATRPVADAIGQILHRASNQTLQVPPALRRCGDVINTSKQWFAQRVFRYVVDNTRWMAGLLCL